MISPASDTSVATVENGYVTLVGNGSTTINYTVTDGTTTVEKSVTIVVYPGADIRNNQQNVIY